MRKLNSDSLSLMSDDVLERISKSIKYKIYNINDKIKNKLIKRSNREMISELTDLQIDYCYIAREAELREKRKTSHQNFLSKK